MSSLRQCFPTQAGWPPQRADELVYVVGVGPGKNMGLQPNGNYLVYFPQIRSVAVCSPTLVFELATSDHRALCQYAITGGRA